MSSTCTTSPSATPADSRSRLWTRSARPFPHRLTLASMCVDTSCIYIPPLNLCRGGPNVAPEPARDGLLCVAACVAGKIHARGSRGLRPSGVSRNIPLRRRRRSMAGARHEHFRFLGDVVPRLVGERLYARGPCAPRLAAPTLWHHPDFLKLWIGQSVSQFGNQFTGLALQLFAVRVLLATPGQMGLLGALGTLPFLLFGLLVGVWVDRHRRRPILIAGDFGRGLVVASIAVLTLLSLARMEYLYLLGFATGILTVFFDVSYQAYLPALVPRDQIVEGNSKLEATNTTAQVSGPVLPGFVIRALGYAAAMAFDGVSFFFSAGLMARIRKPETVPRPSERRSVPKEIREGLRVVFGDRRLWSIAGCTGTSNLFSSALFALFVLYAVRNLGLDEVGLGIIGGLGRGPRAVPGHRHRGLRRSSRDPMDPLLTGSETRNDSASRGGVNCPIHPPPRSMVPRSFPFTSAGLPRKLQDHREPRGRRQSHEQRGPAERRASPRRSRPKGPPSRGGSSIPTRRGRA